jgi:hypothetical protein
MRLLYAALAPFLLGRVTLGCNTVDPDQCWPNTSGGFGGSGTIPIGAGVGVGATSGGDSDSPSGGTPNPCVASPTPSNPDEGGSALDTWISCRGLDAVQCMQKCAEAGAPCSPRMRHPKKSDGGWGDLFNCKNGQPTHVCSYSYSNGDDCIFFSIAGGQLPWCVYTGGNH